MTVVESSVYMCGTIVRDESQPGEVASSRPVSGTARECAYVAVPSQSGCFYLEQEFSNSESRKLKCPVRIL
jgi:hypothetical protein